MPGPLIVVTGTGTGIGKTHVACALLRAAAGRGVRAFGYKPVESGVGAEALSDAERLAIAGSFHVQHPPGLRLRAPISPHLAARHEGAVLDWEAIRGFVADLRAKDVAVLLELPGGLFTPLTDAFRNVDAVGPLAPGLTLLLGSNRLGVLHDVGAALAGAAHVGASVHAVGLVDAATADASTDSNPAEVARIVGRRWVGTWPRGTEEALARCDATAEAVKLWLR